MERPDWLKRVEDEHYEVCTRIDKLEAFLRIPRDPKKVSEKAWELLNKQLSAMREYRDILFLRIDLARTELGLR